jgi:tetratricopeptide (TPR) repeat protein
MSAAPAPAANRPNKFRGFWPHSLGPVHYLLAAVFFLRLICLIRLSASPLLLPSGSDMQFYDEWARQILNGRWTDHQAFYGLPLYPFLLALIYRIFGYGPFVPGLIQALFDAGTAVLIYKIVRRAMQERAPDMSARVSTAVAIAAAAGWCFFVSAEAYSAILMPTSGAVFVSWFVVWQVVRNEGPLSAARCLLLGLLLGVTAMGVASVLFLVPLLVAAMFVRRGPRTLAVALLFTAILAGTAPCWLHNYFVARDPVFLSAHGGINLWLGNNPQANGYPSFPGLHAGQAEMFRDSIAQAEAAAGRILKRSEVSRYWSAKARDYIAANPAAWLKLLARKLGNFWNAFEYDDVGVIANLREHGVVFPGLHFGLVAVLGLVGAIFSWRMFPVSRWVAAAIALQLIAILPVFVTERYRLAVVPGLLVLAVLGLYRLWINCAAGNYRNAAVQIGAVAASAWLVTLPRTDPSLWALDAYNAGRLALETNNLPVAELQLRRAYSLVPHNAETNFALGNLRLAQGDSAAAKKHYEAALRIDGQHKGALNNLGVLALDANEPAAAADYFRRALAVDGRSAKNHYLLAKALDLLGDRPAARSEAARAVELDPDQPEYKALQEQLAGN